MSDIFTKLKNRSRRKLLYRKAEFWDSKANTYDNYAISLWPNLEMDRLMHLDHIECIDKSLPKLKGKRVLDVGCGTGRISLHLAQQGAQVDAVDFSKKTIAYAKMHTHHKNIHYSVGSIDSIDSQNTYDAIVVVGVLSVAYDNASEMRSGLTTLLRSLKKNGILLIIEPLHKGFLARVLSISPKEMCQLLTSLPLDLTQKGEFHFWPVRLSLCFFNPPKIITRLWYRVGKLLLKMRIFRGLGDYSYFVCTKK